MNNKNMDNKGKKINHTRLFKLKQQSLLVGWRNPNKYLDLIIQLLWYIIYLNFREKYNNVSFETFWNYILK